MKHTILTLLILSAMFAGFSTKGMTNAYADCIQYTTTNSQHVAAGRAYTKNSSFGCDERTVYNARGSDERMGIFGIARTTLKTNDNGATYRLGECTVDNDDADGDGYSGAMDCDDSNAAIHPGATEVCDDGIDQNCDGEDPACTPADDDGDGYSADADCDDNNATIHPGAFDFCGDGIDQNCDGGDTACLPAPSCITDLNNWKLKYAPNNANCISCHTTCTPGGTSGRHSCVEGGPWSYSSCVGCHGSAH